jgi:hypothetical protein
VRNMLPAFLLAPQPCRWHIYVYESCDALMQVMNIREDLSPRAASAIAGIPQLVIINASQGGPSGFISTSYENIQLFIEGTCSRWEQQREVPGPPHRLHQPPRPT